MPSKPYRLDLIADLAASRMRPSQRSIPHTSLLPLKVSETGASFPRTKIWLISAQAARGGDKVAATLCFGFLQTQEPSDQCHSFLRSPER